MFLRAITVSSFIVLGLLTGCQHSAETSVAPSKEAAVSARPRKVAVRPVQMRPWPRYVRVQGRMDGYEKTTVSAKTPGRITAVNVDRGTHVTRGQVLVQLDDAELKLRVQQAESQLAQACAVIGMKPTDSEASLNPQNAPPVVLERAMLRYSEASLTRMAPLNSQGVVSDDEFDSMKAQQEVAAAKQRSALNSVGSSIATIGVRRAELALAKDMLAESQILAPFDGVVEERHLSPGEFVQSGRPLVTLVRIDSLRFTAGVPERSSAQIHVGQAVQIECASYDKQLSAALSRISPSVDTQSRVVWVEADVANPDELFRAGQFAEANIIVNAEEKSLSVPLQAITEFAGLEKVYVVRDGVAVEQTIRTDRRDNTWAEVVSGLKEGDVIVASAADGAAGPLEAVPDDTAKSVASLPAK